MKRIFMSILKKKFIRNVMIVATGTAMAQILTFVFLPIITRLYGPEAYGLMGAFLAMIAIITPISALTFPIAIVIPSKQSEALSIIRASIKLTLGISILTFIFLIFFNEEVVELFQLEGISSYLYLIPIVILLSGLSQITRQWLLRNKKFKTIANVTVIQPLIVYGGMSLMGFFFPSASILVVFAAIKSGVDAFFMYLMIQKKDSTIKIKLHESTFSFFSIVKKYRDFPIFRAPEALISAISQNFPVLLLTAFMGPVAAGFYALGRNALSVPGQLIGKAVGDVFYPRIADASNNKENLFELIKKATISLTLVGLLPYGLVILIGPLLFSIVFGSDWITAGEYASWIAVMTFAMFISRPAVHALPVIRAQKFHLNFTILMTLIRILSLYVGLIIFNNDYIGIALFSCTSALLYVILILITLHKSLVYMKSFKYE